MLRFVCRESAQPPIPAPEGWDARVWRLLTLRGVRTPEDAGRFLHPSARDLLDPMTLENMPRAVERILRAKEQGERVLVWGDYDVDGVCAATILTSALAELGVDTETVLPSRQTDGYGLNRAGIEARAGKFSLLVTVDCGISQGDLTDLAKELGMDVIVTDHHRPGERIPECIVVNPLLGDYANRALCGAGVAFQLARALLGKPAMAYIDLACLATVADVVALAGENRAIVALGLESINADPRPGIRAIMDCAQLRTDALESGHIAFQIAPRLNASGRVGSAYRAYRLLNCTTVEEARPIAAELEEENARRRRLEARILESAQAQLASYDFARRRVIVVSGADWETGVAGLAASKLGEKYYLPAIVLCEREGVLTGSCRSIPGVDIFAMLTQASDLLTRFGGHAQAAGVTLPKANLDAFVERLDDALRARVAPDTFVPRIEYDLDASPDDWDVESASALEALQPTGMGNPAPVFRMRAKMLSTRAVGKDRTHLQCTVMDRSEAYKAIWFGAGARADALEGVSGEGLYCPQIDRFNGRAQVQLRLKTFVPGTEIPLSDAETERLRHLFLTDILYNNENEPAAGGARASMSEALEILKRSPYGTLLIATDAENAARILREADENAVLRPDYIAGAYPDDPRAFNALCLLPVGRLPAGYERVLLADAGALAIAGLPSDIRTLGMPGWLDAGVELDGLRETYRALRGLLRRPFAAQSSLALARELARATGCSPEAVYAGLFVLRDLRLIAFEPKPFSIAMRAMAPCDPTASAVYQKLLLFAAKGGA